MLFFLLENDFKNVSRAIFFFSLLFRDVCRYFIFIEILMTFKQILSQRGSNGKRCKSFIAE